MHRITKSDFAKNVLTLITGTSIAQAIPILLSPVFSRLFTPDDFGLFAIFASIVGAFAVVSAGRYEGAIVLPKSDTEAAGIMSLALRITVFLFLGLLVIAVVAEFLLWDHMNLRPQLRMWLLLLPLFVVMNGVTQVFTNWYVRRRAFTRVATARVVQSVTLNVIMLLTGFLGWAATGIFISNLMGLLCLATFLILAGIAGYGPLLRQVERTERTEAARKYRDFPIANGPQALIDMFQMNGVIYLIFAFFSSVVTGLYSFAYRILMAPMNFIGSSMAQVFYQKASETHRNGGDLRPLIRKTMLASALIISPVLLLLLLAGPSLFAFVFGEEWRDAGAYARWLAPWFCLDFVRAPVSQIPMVIGKIKTMLSFTFIGNLVLVAAMITGGLWLGDIRFTLMLLSAAMCIYTTFILIWLYRCGTSASVKE